MARFNTRRAARAIFEEWEPRMRDAFLLSIEKVRDEVLMERLIRAIEVGDLQDALEALSIDEAAFAAYTDAMSGAYTGTGRAVADTIPNVPGPSGKEFVIRFNSRSPRAEAYLRDQSGKKIREIIEDQRVGARNFLQQSLRRGRNPRDVARDLVGRYDPKSKQRVGGLIGLTARQMDWVDNAREELTSGQYAKYLQRKQRDRRFDPTVRKAAANGEALSDADVNRMVGRYKDGLLLYRGEVIGRTETLQALNSATDEAFRQMLDTTGIPQSDVKKVWLTGGDGRVRASHAALNGVAVMLHERFDNGLQFPLDPTGPVEEVANCRCIVEYDVDFLASAERANRQSETPREPLRLPMWASGRLAQMRAEAEAAGLPFDEDAAARQILGGGGGSPAPMPGAIRPLPLGGNDDRARLLQWQEDHLQTPGLAALRPDPKGRYDGHLAYNFDREGLLVDFLTKWEDDVIRMVSPLANGPGTLTMRAFRLLDHQRRGANRNVDYYVSFRHEVGGKGGTRVDRTFYFQKDGVLIADQTLTQLPKEAQGGGIAKKWLRDNIDLYQRMGVAKVELHANIDVGGYAWARYGYVPLEKEWKKLRVKIAGRLERLSIDEDVKAHVREILKDDDPKAIWRIADLTVPVRKGKSTLGKALLLRSDWLGTLPLDDAEAMARFKAYVDR